jgi:hypothetical protein
LSNLISLGFTIRNPETPDLHIWTGDASRSTAEEEMSPWTHDCALYKLYLRSSLYVYWSKFFFYNKSSPLPCRFQGHWLVSRNTLLKCTTDQII